MEDSLKDFFANAYPKASNTNGQKYKKTPINQAILYQENKSKLSQTKSKYQLLIIIFLSLLSAFVFSTTFYTWTDHIFGTINLELFDPENGQPKLAAIVIHIIIFALLTWVILKAFGVF